MKDKKIVHVKELYTDEEKTLAQCIVYAYGDERERDWCRKQINPHLTKLVYVTYFNKEWKVVKEEKYGII